MNKRIETIINELKDINNTDKSFDFFISTFTREGNIYKYIRKIALDSKSNNESIKKYYKNNTKLINSKIEDDSDSFDNLELNKNYGLGDVTSILNNYFKTPMFIYGEQEDEGNVILVSRKLKNSINGWNKNKKYNFEKKSVKGNYDIPTNTKLLQGDKKIALFEKNDDTYLFLGYFQVSNDRDEYFELEKYKSEVKVEPKVEKVVKVKEVKVVENSLLDEDRIKIEERIKFLKDILESDNDIELKTTMFKNNIKEILIIDEGYDKTVISEYFLKLVKQYLKLVKLSENSNRSEYAGITNKDKMDVYYIDVSRDNLYKNALNKNNTLLLSNVYGYLFENGDISFTKEGEIMFSSTFDKDIREKLILDKNIKLNRSQIKFLEYHRTHVFKK